jgi:type IV pilus assembly protein PilV
MVNIMTFDQSPQLQRGALMLEVLVTLVVLAIGLLGLAGLQTRLQAAEMESYQRSQAILLLNDMANRIQTNPGAAADYATGQTLGVGEECPAAGATPQTRDLSEWCLALRGAAEKSGANDVGAMVGGRGCIQSVGTNQYMITVAWQGLTPISAPPESVSCGVGLYDAEASRCSNDLCRRAVTTIVRIANLS